MKMIATILAAFAMTICSSATPDEYNSKSMPQDITSTKYTDLDATDFAKLIEDGKVQLLDARTADEYAERHIAGSVNIDIEAEGFKEKASETLKKDSPVAVYCHSGRRSITASISLIEEGFTQVYNLKTGINGWIQSGLPTESE